LVAVKLEWPGEPERTTGGTSPDAGAGRRRRAPQGPDYGRAGRQRAVHADAAWVLDRDELVRRFAALPADVFPFTTRYATELNAGEGHDRFDFALGLMIDGLRPGLETSSGLAALRAE
jgi:hypothetical protein